MIIDDILEEIKKADKIVILTHETPDGDAVGSALAMKHAIAQIGKKVDVIIPEFSDCFKFLPGTNEIIKDSKVEKYDLAIAVDCADYKILKGFDPYFEKAKVKIVIDHHGSNKMYGDINFVNPVAPACCQILVGMFEYLGVNIDKKIGTCIITGIITDTGGFNYNVTAETFEFAAELLRKGVDTADVYKRTMQTKTKANFELNRLASERMEFFFDGKVAFTYITLADEKKFGAKTGDHEGLVDIGRCIEGVEVSVFLHENKGKDNGFKLSLRSCEYVNVSDVCLMFGGGGHLRAAGAWIPGTVEQIREKVLAEIKKQLK